MTWACSECRAYQTSIRCLSDWYRAHPECQNDEACSSAFWRQYWEWLNKRQEFCRACDADWSPERPGELPPGIEDPGRPSYPGRTF